MLNYSVAELRFKRWKIGCLSKNVNLTNRVDPDVLNDWMISQQLFD